jgi:hypothetical protein
LSAETFEEFLRSGQPLPVFSRWDAASSGTISEISGVPPTFLN